MPLKGGYLDIIGEFLTRDYDIKIIPSLSCDVMIGEIGVWDHSFLGETYKDELKERINNIRLKAGFYDGQD